MGRGDGWVETSLRDAGWKEARLMGLNAFDVQDLRYLDHILLYRQWQTCEQFRVAANQTSWIRESHQMS